MKNHSRKCSKKNAILGCVVNKIYEGDVRIIVESLNR